MLMRSDSWLPCLGWCLLVALGLLGAGAGHARVAAARVDSVRDQSVATAPLSGAEAHAYLRKLARRLRVVVHGTPVEILPIKGELLRLRIPAVWLFRLDAAQLLPEATSRLQRLTAILDAADRAQLAIVGHSDSLGPRDVNAAFTMRRAAAVADFMQRQGLAPQRVTALGAGERERLEVREDTPAARQRNRRIEIEIRPFRPSPREAF